MREMLFLIAHALANLGFATLAMIVGSRLTDSQTEEVTGIHTIIQLSLASLIVFMARPGTKVATAFASTAAAAWGLWCSFIAAMALSGTWL